MKVSDRTLTNYQALIAHQSDVSISKTVVTKSVGRFTAENSLISAMALLCVIAATHYVIVPEIRKELYHDAEESTQGASTMFKLMQKVHNDAPLFVVRPELIFSTDDTVQYAFEGKGVKKDSFRLVATTAQKNTGTRSKC